MMRLLTTVGLALTLAAASAPAHAIIGGREGGPLEASAVMVLTDAGGVCSGVVVARDVVLTAAHCVPAGPSVAVHFRDASGQPVLLRTASIARHPEYRANAVAERTRSIDLALIRTAEPLPAQLGPAALSASAPRDRVIAGGFGPTTPGDASTGGRWRSATLQVVWPHDESRLLIWAQGSPAGSPCQGDSGGPLIGPDDAVVAIIGWTTDRRASRCGDLTQGVLAGPQRGWIDGTLTRWGRSASWR
jgi:secreted trypsin-like serine protease